MLKLQSHDAVSVGLVSYSGQQLCMAEGTLMPSLVTTVTCLSVSWMLAVVKNGSSSSFGISRLALS